VWKIELEAEFVSTTENGLLREARAGSREALGELLMKHERSCYDLALYLTGNESDAEDVCQDAFSRVARDIGDSAEVHEFRSWLLRIVVCAHRNRLDSEVARRRRERSYAVQQETAVDVAESSSIKRDELRRHLDASLAQLEEGYRLPIVLHHRQALSYAEVAAVLALPEGTVATNIRRGLEKLRRLMAKAGYGCTAPAVVATLQQSPAVSVPASLTAFIKSLAPGVGVTGKAVAEAGTAAGGLVLGWKFLMSLGVAALLGAGAFAGWKLCLPQAAAPARPAVPPGPVEEELVVPRGAYAGPTSATASSQGLFLSRLRREGCAVESLGITWGRKLLIPPNLRGCSVGRRAFVDALAKFNGLRVQWSGDGKRAVLFKGASDEEIARVKRMSASLKADQRVDAAWEASFLSDLRVVPVLFSLADDKSPEVSSQALIAMHDLGWRAIAALDGERTWPLALRILQGSQLQYRGEALQGLVATRDKRAVPLLAAILDGRISDSWNLRATAARCLGWIEGEKIVPLFEKALANRDWVVRRDATESLSIWNGSKAVGFLKTALKDRDNRVRKAAVESLGVIGSREAVRILRQNLDGAVVRGDVFKALARCVSPEAKQVLVDALRKAEGTERNRLLEAVAIRGGKWAQRILEKECEANPENWPITALGEQGSPAAVTLLAKALRSDRAGTRAAAVEALGKIGGPEALKLLEQAAADKSAIVRRKLAQELFWAGSPKVTNLLGRLLNDPETGVRNAAVGQMCWQGEGRALAFLKKACHDPDGSVSRAAMITVRSLGGPPSQEILEGLLQDANPGVRIEAAAQLTWLHPEKPESAYRVIEKALGDPDRRVRAQAANAIGAAFSRLHRLPRDQRLAMSEKALESGQPGGAIRAIIEGDGDRAVVLLNKAFDAAQRSAKGAVIERAGRVCGPEALPLIKRAIADKDARRAVPGALASIGGEAAWGLMEKALSKDPGFFGPAALDLVSSFKGQDVGPVLRKGLKHRDPMVRQRAAMNLGMLGGERGLVFIREALANPNARVRLGAISAVKVSVYEAEKALPLLKKALADSDKSVRWQAVTRLKDFDGSAALELLGKALEDREEHVWRAALRVIRESRDSGATTLLEKALSSENPKIRACAVAQIPFRARELLRRGLRDADLSVRLSAAGLWNRYGMPFEDTLPILDAALSSREVSLRREAVNVLRCGKRNAKTFLLLQKVVADEDPYVRGNAIGGLAYAGGTRAMEQLLKALRDQHAYVREHAAWGLAHVGGATARDALIRALLREKNKFTAGRMVEHIKRAFPEDLTAQKALAGFRLPSVRRPVPHPEPHPAQKPDIF
jgi:RNA polymerase sigma factor (sigma-70 family)